MNESVDVRITGDATGAVAASKESAGAVAEASSLMRSKLAEIQESARIAFGGMGEAAVAGAAKVSEASKMVEMAGERMAAGASVARTQWSLVGEGFSKLNGIILGITAVLAGGEMFKDAISASTHLTSENLRLSRALGVTLEKASGVHAAMNKLGIETDTVTNASQKMVRQLKAHEDGFNKIGIATRDANGHFRTTLDILTDGLGKLGEYKAGVDRTALSQMMFGRGAGDLTTLMRLNNKEIEEGTRVARELGLVTTEEGVVAMRAYKDSTREVSEIMEAFKVTLGQALLPVLTEVSQWFQAHGPAAIRVFRGVVVDLIDTFKSAAATINWMIAQIKALGTSISSFVEVVSGKLEILKVGFETTGKVLRDALTLNWGSIEADWNAGMAKIDAIASSHAQHIASEMDKANAAIDRAAYAMRNIGQDGMVDQFKGDPRSLDRSLLGGLGPDPEPGGLRADDIKGGKGPREKKGPKDKKGPAGPSLLEEWNNELDKALSAEKNWGVDELAFTLKFWEDKLALHKGKAKELLELENKVNKLKLQSHKEVLQEELKDDRQHAALLAEAAQSEIALQREVLGAKLDIIAQQERAGKLSATNAARQRAELNRQIYQLDLDLEQKLYVIKLNELKSARSIYREQTKEYRDYTRQIELLEQQHQNRMVLLNKQAARKISADQAAAADMSRQKWQGLANGFAGALSRMATLQAGFMTTIKSLWGSLVGFVAQILEQIIAKFIMAQLVKLGLVKAEGVSTIATEAAKAGAGGTASMAAAPFPLNLGAPAFGASMAALALSFAPAASAMGGWDVPGGAGAGIDGRGGRTAVIHPREMVLPADLADKVRGGDAGGGNHLHLHGTIIHNPAQLKRWFETNQQAVGAGVRKFVRNGGNTTTAR